MFKQRGILDYCPICGTLLDDDFIGTRHRHDKEHHPEYLQLQNGGEDDVE